MKNITMLLIAGLAMGLTGSAMAKQSHKMPKSAPVKVIWDDDCSDDPDCNFAIPAMHKWIEAGKVEVLAFIANSSNPYSAPVFKIYETYYHHTNIPIGAYQGSDNSAKSTSAWAKGLVAKFDAGDIRSQYSDCVSVYRKALAQAPDKSVKLISTGFLTCVSALMNSPSDALSPLSGAELIKKKVTGLYVMGGDYPNGNEFNFQGDAPAAHNIYANWTAQNGFPNIYSNGFTPGSTVMSGVPLWFDDSYPQYFQGSLSQTYTRPSWDTLSVYQAVFGLSDFILSANGTNSVEAATGINHWSSDIKSGHYYLSLAKPSAYYAKRLYQTTYGQARAKTSN